MEDRMYFEDAARELQYVTGQLLYGFSFTVRKVKMATDDTVMVDIMHIPFEKEMAEQIALLCVQNDDIMWCLIRSDCHYWNHELCSITKSRPGAFDLKQTPVFATAWNKLMEVQKCALDTQTNQIGQ